MSSPSTTPAPDYVELCARPEVGRVIYRLGTADPFVVVAGLVARLLGSSSRVVLYAVKAPSTSSPKYFRMRLYGRFFNDPDYRRIEKDGSVWYHLWTFDRAAWLKSEQMRKAEPAREWVEPPPGAYDPTADLEKRRLAEMELAKLLPATLENIACYERYEEDMTVR